MAARSFRISIVSPDDTPCPDSQSLNKVSGVLRPQR
jgi:hypothetical protein